MHDERIRAEYFEWMYGMTCRERYPQSISFRKLLTHLYNTDFRYSMHRDSDRASDGRRLRYRFGNHMGYSEFDIRKALDSIFPCSVLEMMIALAIRIEEDIMDNAEIGDRTNQWFWIMIVNLGLGDMMDDRYDEEHVEEVLNRFLDREYEPNGKGGLFYIRNARRDVRNLEIWYQMCEYLNGIV